MRGSSVRRVTERVGGPFIVKDRELGQSSVTRVLILTTSLVCAERRLIPAKEASA